MSANLRQSGLQMRERAQQQSAITTTPSAPPAAAASLGPFDSLATSIGGISRRLPESKDWPVLFRDIGATAAQKLPTAHELSHISYQFGGRFGVSLAAGAVFISFALCYSSYMSYKRMSLLIVVCAVEKKVILLFLFNLVLLSSISIPVLLFCISISNLIINLFYLHFHSLLSRYQSSPFYLQSFQSCYHSSISIPIVPLFPFFFLPSPFPLFLGRELELKYLPRKIDNTTL